MCLIHRDQSREELSANSLDATVDVKFRIALIILVKNAPIAWFL